MQTGNGMKKGIVLLASILMLVVSLLVFLIRNQNTPQQFELFYTVNFESNGGSNVSAKRIIKGGTMAMVTPRYDGYEFDGWYLDDECKGEAFDFDTPITHSMILYAKWKSVYDYMFTDNSEAYQITGYHGTATEITLPKSLNNLPIVALNATFQNQTQITSVTIPNSYERIGNHTFDGCTNLTKVVMPNTITEIGDYAFKDCSALTTINLPKYINRLGDLTFSNCTNLTALEIPENVREIGNYVFQDCVSLAQIEIPAAVTKIGNSAFKGCMGLTTMNLPDDLTSVQDNVFDGCSQLATINCDIYPAKPDSWGNYWLGNCSAEVTWLLDYELVSDNYYQVVGWNRNVNKIELPTMFNGKRVKTIASRAFQQCPCTKVVIPDGITNIGVDAFDGCTQLTQINCLSYPERPSSWSVDWLGSCTATVTWQFNYQYNSSSLSWEINGYNGTDSIITLPTTYQGQPVTGIAAQGFINNLTLENVCIPSTILFIGDRAFAGCERLTLIDCTAFADKPAGWQVNYLGDCKARVKWLLDYQLIDTEQVALVGYNGQANEIIIPATFMGYQVTTIREGTFANSTIQIVVIPECITNIGAQAFDGCTNLVAINCVTDVKPDDWDDNWLGDCDPTIVVWSYSAGN